MVTNDRQGPGTYSPIQVQLTNSTAAYSAQLPLEGADRMQMEVKEDNGGNKNILIFDVTPVLMLHSPSP